MAGLDLTAMQSPAPKGILRLQGLECSNLPAGDVNFRLNPSSDPYVNVRCGDASVKSEVRWQTLNPKWDLKDRFVKDLFVHTTQQMVEIDVFDHDTLHDDLLGRLRVSVGRLVDEGAKSSGLRFQMP